MDCKTVFLTRMLAWNINGIKKLKEYRVSRFLLGFWKGSEKEEQGLHFLKTDFIVQVSGSLIGNYNTYTYIWFSNKLMSHFSNSRIIILKQKFILKAWK